jgi:phosphatidylserine synthase 2
LVEKDYINGCEIFTPNDWRIGLNNLNEKIDVYVVAHFLGWVGKMIIIRDLKMCLFLSVFFEFLELTFKYWLPNFNECW